MKKSNAPKPQTWMEPALEILFDEAMVVDPNFNILDINDKVCRTSNIKKEDAIGQHCYEVTHQLDKPCDLPLHDCPVKAVLKTGKQEKSVHIHSHDGKDVYVESIAAPLKWEDGKLTQILKVSRDITSEKDMWQRANFLANIAENISDSICTVNKEGNFTSWNKYAEHLFGYTSHEILGEHISKIIPEDRINEIDHCMTSLSKGETITNYKTERLKKDGTRLPVELNAAALRDEKGNIIGFTSIMRDISEKKKAEEVTVYLASIVENSPDAIISLDLDGAFRSWNKGAEEIFGYKKEEIIGKPFGFNVPLDRQDLCYSLLEQAFDKGFLKDIETTRLAKDGRVVPLDMSLSPLYNKQGDHVGYTFIMRDISDRKESEKKLIEAHDELGLAYEELKKVDRLKDNILASVSHELKTPLTIIKGAIELAREEEILDDRNALLDQAMDSSRQQEIIINNLLGFPQISRQFNKDGSSTGIQIYINDIINNLISHPIFIDKAKAKKITIKANLDKNIPMAKLTLDGIQTAIRNILDNAIKFNKDGGKVEISTRLNQGGFIEVSISDTGIGIPQEELENIYEPLIQLGPPVQKRFGGTGMGLAIAKKIVEFNGGKIWAESQMGKGSTFYFTVPV